MTDEVWRDEFWRAVTSGKLCNHRSRYQTVQLSTELYLLPFQMLSVLYLWEAFMEVFKSYFWYEATSFLSSPLNLEVKQRETAERT